MASLNPEAKRILLLGPNRWSSAVDDPEAGLHIRRSIVMANHDLAVSWLIMEDDESETDLTRKFLHLLTERGATHVFVLWPLDAAMVGAQDELVMWRLLATLRPDLPECYLFHQENVLEIQPKGRDVQVVMRDDQGKSPYLYDLLAKGVFLEGWGDEEDLRKRVREVLIADLGAKPREA